MVEIEFARGATVPLLTFDNIQTFFYGCYILIFVIIILIMLYFFERYSSKFETSHNSLLIFYRLDL